MKLHDLGRRLAFALALLGLDALKLFRVVRGAPAVFADYRRFSAQRQQSADRDAFARGSIVPITDEKGEQAGVASGHYFHQDLVVAREIFQADPRRHIDVGSSVYGFVSHVASFRDVELIDRRHIESNVEGIHFVQADLLDPTTALPQSDSVSCLHALEHFGLGRYGDPVDFDGWRTGLDALTSMVLPDGRLYLSVPTGRVQRVDFNAHRVFSLPFLHAELSKHFDVVRTDFVGDDGHLVRDVAPTDPGWDRSFEANYGCSIWVLHRPADRGGNAR